MDLIPGLPDDVARECLTRVSYKDFPVVASVCKGWKAEIESPDFLVRRKAAGTSQVLVVLRYDRPDGTEDYRRGKFQLAVFEPLSGRWSTVPRTPGFCYGTMSSMAAIGSDLAVFGVSNTVWIYNFQTSRWRPGTDMPGRKRLGFACATDGERMVYVAGGCGDGEGSSYKSAMAYDLKTDEWDVEMPDMPLKCFWPCKGIFRCGRFHVISGLLGSWASNSIQTFDTRTRRWEPARVNFLETDETPPGNWVNGNGTFDFMCVQSHRVVGCNGSVGRKVADNPSICYFSPTCLARWHEKLMLVGTDLEGRTGDWLRYQAYILDLISYEWSPKIEFPQSFSLSSLHNVCCLEI